MADNLLPIGTCLEQIENAVYGREVRQAIHDGIAQCYDDTVEGVNAAQQAASDTQNVIDNAVAATNAANTAAAEASNVKVEQTVSGDTVTFTTTKRDGTTVSTSFQKPNIVVSKDEGSGEFSVTAKGWNGEEIIAKIPDPSEEVKSRATIAAVSKVKTALGNPLTITDGMDAPAVKTVVTLEPKQDLHGYDHPWVGGAGKNLYDPSKIPVLSAYGITATVANDGTLTFNGTATANAYFSVGGLGLTFSNGSTISLNNPSTNSGVHVSLRSSNNAYYGDIAANEINKTNTRGESDCDAVVIYITANTTLSNFTMKIQLEAGRTATTYEPYSNICPIEGYDTVRVTATGKNLFDGVIKMGSVSDITGDYVDSSSQICCTNYIPVKPGVVYTMSRSAAESYMNMRLYDANKRYLGSSAAEWFVPINVAQRAQPMNGGKYSATFAFKDPVAYIRFQDRTTDLSIKYQLEFGYEATEYEPYQASSNTTSLSVAQSAGATVYGGTVTLNEDGSGALVVDRVKAVITEATSGLQYDTNNRLYIPSTAMLGIKGATSSNDVADATSNQFACVTTNGTYNNTMEGFAVAPSGACYLYSSKFASLDAWKTHLQANNLEIEGAIATPTTYQLTADQLRTLTGENHVWTDGTKLELTYRADKYADVEKFLNAIPTGTKTGNPAVFADGADDLPFEKLTIAVEPHQEGSGDPSPDNVRPITGWDEVKVTRCGKNLFDPNVENLTSYFGTISRHGHKYTQTGQYTITVASDGPNTFYKVCKTDLSDFSASAGFMISAGRTLTPTVAEGQMMFVYVESTNVIKANKIFVALGKNVEYEDYIGSILPISLKYATGSTVYGGTVTINRDGTGSVVVDRAVTTLANKTFTDKQSSALAAGGFIGVSGFKDWIDTSTVIKSDMLVGTTFANRGADGVIAPLSAAESVNSLAIFTTKTRDEAVAAYKNATICYKLATPTTYTLTAPQLTSLLGNNAVWCDAGQVTVKYKRDIGKMISNLYALMVDTGVIVIENEEDVTVEGPGYP